MCIRDRKKPEHVLKAFIRFALAQGAITYGMELMPVSYTHLDVYKRQLYGLTQGKSGN